MSGLGTEEEDRGDDSGDLRYFVDAQAHVFSVAAYGVLISGEGAGCVRRRGVGQLWSLRRQTSENTWPFTEARTDIYSLSRYDVI